MSLPFPPGPPPEPPSRVNERVLLRGHHVIVVRGRDDQFYLAICQHCGLREEFRFSGRVLGITDRMIACDLAARLLSRIPESVACHEVRDWRTVSDVMES